MRRQDTSRARVQVVEPFVGDLRVAQVFKPRNLLPSTFGEERALQAPETGPISEPQKLRLELRRTLLALPGRSEAHVFIPRGGRSCGVRGLQLSGL